MFLTKITILILKTFIIYLNKFTKHLTLNLLNKVIYGIAIDEMAFFCIVGMEIEIEGETVGLIEVGC
jgi:hypothetical protein